MEGVYIISSKPTFISRDDMSAFGFEFETFEFVEMIRSGEKLTVEFSAEALQAGVFEGEIDVCINTGTLCKSLPAYTIIEE